MSEKYSFWVTLRPQSDRCCRGEAEVRILYFKTTWSESQKVSQTATEQGKAEQCIFDFKTTWSEFQKPSQTAGSITSKIIFSKKSLSVPMSVCLSACLSVPSPKKVTETENITKQSCQINIKGKRNTFKVKLPPLQCWARQS